MATFLQRLPGHLADLRLGTLRTYSAAIIVATLGLAVFMARRPSVVFLAMSLGAVVVYLVLRWPGLGPTLVVVTALVVPFSIGTGTQSSLNMPLILVPLSLSLWVSEHLYQRSFKIIPSPTNWPLVGLVCVTLISLLAGNIGWIPFAQGAPLRSQLGGAGVFVLSAGAFFLTGHQVRSLRWLKSIAAVFVVLGGIYILGRLVGRAPWLALYSNGAIGSLFWVWLVACTLGMALFNSEIAIGWRVGLAAVGLATLGVAMTGAAREWISGWLPALFAAGILLYLRWPRLGTAAFIVLLIAGFFSFEALQGFLLRGNEYSLLSRQAALEIILHITRASPLIGLGPSNYYYYTPLFPILGWYVNFNSHNQYADIVAQIGFVGMFFILWFFAAAARLAWTLRRTASHPFGRAYANMCLAGLAGMLVSGLLGDWYLPFVYNIGLSGFRASVLGWLFLGGLVAVQHLNVAAPAPDA